MKKQLKINEQQMINYEIRKSKRAKRMRLAVYCDGSVVATLPWWGSITRLESFIVEKTDWIFGKLKIYKKNSIESPLSKYSQKDFTANKQKAFRLAKEKADYFAQIYGLDYRKITIRNQKTRWGSCSSKGNLSFNYKIVFLPEEFVDYIVVHELCHLQEFNHSENFWSLVEKTIPAYKSIVRQVRKM